ncbi:MAG: phosphotransferase family protein, partial [Actinomycetota bacterium]|nr:phosphotransferase family protein [Actinomycetota bacterium]
PQPGTPEPGATPAGADPAVVGPYLATVLDDAGWRDCEITLIAGGKSNLTYRVDAPAGSVVLRRPPLGHVLPTAHDMVREHRIIAALGPTAVPVPRALASCTDDGVIGAPFYVMSKVEGYIVRDELPPGYADEPAQCRAIGEGLVDVLVALHAVDYSAVGLGDYGRPDGYLERQLRRWSKQWEQSKAQEMPALDRLAADLAGSLPASPPTTIVHGDYRLDNTMLDPTEPGRIAAVLDWELSTLGDPLADVGLLMVYWSESDDPPARRAGMVTPAATRHEGFPSRAEVVELYAARSGRSVDALPWYVAFGFFKLAVVCAGIAARHRAGAMLGEGFDNIGERVAPLVEMGRTALADSSLA